MAGVGRRDLHVAVPVLLPRMARLGDSGPGNRGDCAHGAGDTERREAV